MSTVKEMFIYTAFDGIETTAVWKDDEEYELIKKFLKERGVSVCGVSSNNQTVPGDFVYIKTEQQLDELENYARSLREQGEA